MDVLGLAMIAVIGFLAMAVFLDLILTPLLARKMVERTMKVKSRAPGNRPPKNPKP